jgi:hypothetical protein
MEIRYFEFHTTTGLAVSLAPLHKSFGIKNLFMTSMQAVSGAGRSGGVIVLDLAEPDVSQAESVVGTIAVADGVPTRTDKASAVSKLKAWFSKLKLKTAETRAAWLEQEHGRKTLERLGLTFDDARPLVEAAGRKGGRFGREREASTRGGNPNPLVTTAGGNPAVTVTTAAEVTTEVTTVSPAPPSGERKTKKEADSGANNPAVTVTTAAEVTDLPGAPPRLSAWERTTARVSAAEVLFTLRTDGGLRLSAGPVQENELDGVLQGVTPAWTLDGARHLARHIKAEHLRDGWRPSIAHLRGRDGSWTTLLSLYDEAQTCERCARARPATTTSKPAAKAVVEPAKPRLSPEEIRERMSKVTAALQQNEVNK